MMADHQQQQQQEQQPAAAPPPLLPAPPPPAALLRHITPDETAAEFFRRHAREALACGLTFIDAYLRLRPGHLVELVGPAGAAKTELLIQIACNVLLASVGAASGEAGSGEQEHVVIIDCDGKFDMLRLLQVLYARPQLQSSGSPEQQQAKLDAVLTRLHLVRCWNSTELLLALHALPQQLRGLQGRCRLLLLDNIAATAWLDRAAVFSSSKSQLPPTTQQQQQQQAWPVQQPDAAHNKAAAAAGGAPSAPSCDALRVQGAVAAVLQAVSAHFRCPVVATKQAGVSQLHRDGGTRLVQRELLTAPWLAAVTHRLLLMPAPAPPGIPGFGGQQQQAQSSGGAKVLLQWQAGDYCGPLQACVVGASQVQAAMVGG